MAAVAPSADQAADLLQKLSLDSQNKSLEIAEPKKKPVDSKDVGNGQIQPVDRSVTPLLPDFMDPTLCYVPNGYPSYYYGYDGSGNEWEDYTRYVNPEGVEMTGAYGDNGSFMYQHGYGYAPYSPYSPATSPVPTVGHDGQLYGAQHYHYPYFQPLPPTSTPYTTPVAPPKGEIATSAAADQAPLSVDSANGNSNGVANGGVKGNTAPTPVRPAFQNSSLNANGSFGRGGALPGGVASGYQDPRFGFDGVMSPIPWLDGSMFTDGLARPVASNPITPSFSNGGAVPSSKNQNVHPHLMGLHHPRPSSGMNTTNGYMNTLYPNKFYGRYGNTFSSGMGFGSNRYDSRATGRGWTPVDNRFKPRGRGNSFYGYGNENMDGLNELNRGPRGKGSKNQKGFTPVALAVKGQNIPLTVTSDAEKDKPSLIPDKEQYNRPDFPVTYTDAKFFIIKSYSEDDVHKSIKYNVWASTPNGNKKLDAAYQEAQQKSGGCPIFLFFSVNTSGQFVGVAEMVGPVDFNKSVEYWQQDKWIGCFPVKWHIVKDVPNSLLKHITLENNENKPVTNSRDTQEVKMEQGLQVIEIFKDHISKQCILDDFEFYEDRQKRIQEKKAKQQLFQKQSHLWEGKATEEKNKDNSNGELKSQKLSEVSAVLSKESSPAAQSNGEVKLVENGSITKLGDDVKVAKLVTVSDKKPVAKGIANGAVN
ncbi:YTH domain-containing protein ECT2-like [Nicotiana tomentosiformis]|uniref:YTH domain-containing protein ECT2-like n=1 Tax=Nicotiana tomentosiformis TaxID=4098 RepID=UPI00388C8076